MSSFVNASLYGAAPIGLFPPYLPNIVLSSYKSSETGPLSHHHISSHLISPDHCDSDCDSQFCPVVGEIAADLILSGSTEHDISLFSLDARKHPGSHGPLEAEGAINHEV